MYNGQKVRRPHPYDCAVYGKCTDPNCGYEAGHPEARKAAKQRAKAAKAAAKLKQQQDRAAISGLNQTNSVEFDGALQDAMEQAGFDR